MYYNKISSPLWVCGCFSLLSAYILITLGYGYYKKWGKCKGIESRSLALFSLYLLMLLIENFILGFGSQLDFLYYLTESLKGLVAFIYLEMCIRLIGWENVEGATYSIGKFESILIRQSPIKGLFGDISLQNHEEVAWFMLRSKISLVQYFVLSFAIFALATFLRFISNDSLKFGLLSPFCGFLWLFLFKIISSLPQMYHFTLITNCFSHINLTQNTNFFNQLMTMKYFILVSELQIIPISLISSFTNAFGPEGVTISCVFVTNFFYTIEIILFAVVALNVFSYEDAVVKDIKEDTSSNITEISSR